LRVIVYISASNAGEKQTKGAKNDLFLFISQNNLLYIAGSIMFKLKSFRIDGYKLLTMPQPIELSPFTFLFGGNGSGKSSLIEALRLFAENIKDFSPDMEGDEFTLVTDRNLGTFDDILNKNSSDQLITYEFFFEHSSDTTTLSANDDKYFRHIFYKTPKHFRIKLSFSQFKANGLTPLNCLNVNKMKLHSWEIEDYDSGFQLGINGEHLNLRLGSISLNSEFINSEYYNSDFNADTLRSNHHKVFKIYQENPELVYRLLEFIYVNDFNREYGQFTLFSPFQILISFFNPDFLLEQKGFAESVKGSFRDIVNLYAEEEDLFHNEASIYNCFYLFGFFMEIIVPFCKFAFAGLQEVFKNLQHLGHFRTEVPSFFSLSDKRNSYDEDKFLTRLVKTLDIPRYTVQISEEDKSDNRMNEFHSAFAKIMDPKIAVDEILRELELGEEITFDKIDEIYRFFLVQNGSRINLANTSSGFKQIFPIILHYVKSFTTDFLIVEQPELHLHPKLQSKLLEMIAKYNEGLNIIETHSEHMIRKMQVLVAEKKISHQQVKVYYFQRQGSKTKVVELRLDENGLFLDKWPNGFFDEAAELSNQLMEVLANRKN
jgi:AAA15 family ATPase/GTPase